nr:alpha/beta hydrolase [uncultured Rhodopila sp.]
MNKPQRFAGVVLVLAAIAASPVRAQPVPAAVPPAASDFATLEAAMGAANAHPGARTAPGKVIPVPDTTTPEFKAVIAAPYRVPAWNADPKTADEWRALVARLAASVAATLPALRDQLGVSIRPAVIGGVKGYVLEPADIPPENRNRVLFNIHGGGYVYGPGEAGTLEATLMAGYGHFKVIAVDYRMPPDAPYPAAMDDAMAAYKGVLSMTDPGHVAVFGTSTGGGMTLALMLRAKAENVPLPVAMAPGTPWSDLTETGDTYKTNEWIDNVLVSYSGYLTHAAALYANGHDLKDPQLSPIYGDFHGLPPAILTSGTRDLFLSNTVRTHRKLRQAGVEASLQVFEGASHGQYGAPNTPEAREAFGEIAQFFDAHLAK